MNRATTDVIVRSHERQPENPVVLFPGTCVACGPDRPIRAYETTRQCGHCGKHWVAGWTRGRPTTP